MHVACGRGSIVGWRHCNTLCTSGFVDYVMAMFSQAQAMLQCARSLKLLNEWFIRPT